MDIKKKRANSLNELQMKQFSFGDFLIKETIGKGTFSKVKLGINKITGEKVAIKILDKSKILEKEDLERIIREMQILSKMDHENVIKVYQIFEDNNNYFIIMEYCEGGELFNYIVKKGRLSEQEASFFFYQIINGIEYIFSKGIAHRDLKPENLLLDKNHIIKIIDFGLSNFFDGEHNLVTPCGSPCYASPEMVSGNDYNGFNIDIWATGIILFAMTCGYLPFEDSDNDKLFQQILKAELEFPSHLSELCKDIIRKILVTDPNKRITIEKIKKHNFYIYGKDYFNKKTNKNIFKNKIKKHNSDDILKIINYESKNENNKINNDLSKMNKTVKIGNNNNYNINDYNTNNTNNNYNIDNYNSNNNYNTYNNNYTEEKNNNIHTINIENKPKNEHYNDINYSEGAKKAKNYLLSNRIGKYKINAFQNGMDFLELLKNKKAEKGLITETNTNQNKNRFSKSKEKDIKINDNYNNYYNLDSAYSKSIEKSKLFLKQKINIRKLTGVKKFPLKFNLTELTNNYINTKIFSRAKTANKNKKNINKEKEVINSLNNKNKELHINNVLININVNSNKEIIDNNNINYNFYNYNFNNNKRTKSKSPTILRFHHSKIKDFPNIKIDKNEKNNKLRLKTEYFECFEPNFRIVQNLLYNKESLKHRLNNKLKFNKIHSFLH